ncbi:hypothetical protein AWENTII_000474 [Aspergillus wentii]|nr:hypothetical protein MW887_005181 [Aspergillus wentii]
MASLSLHLKGLKDTDPWIGEQKVFEILNEYLRPSSTTTPAIVAQRIDQLTPMKRNELGTRKEMESPESFMWGIWSYFITLAKQIPYDHPSQDRLVAVVYALSELPSTTVDIWESDVRIWTDLPILGPCMREAWNSPTSPNLNPSKEKATEWINLNSFAARLLRHPAVSWTIFAVWGLFPALEIPSEGPKLDCDVIAAAEWIIHSGDVLLKQINQDRGVRSYFEKVGAGSLYQREDTLNTGRWQFWKRRFGEIKEQVSEDGKIAAQRAIDRMEELDT